MTRRQTRHITKLYHKMITVSNKSRGICTGTSLFKHILYLVFNEHTLSFFGLLGILQYFMAWKKNTCPKILAHTV